jgi:hypothetical protein
MANIANLQIVINGSSINPAIQQLSNLANQAGSTQNAINQLGSSGGNSIGQLAGGVALGTAAMQAFNSAVEMVKQTIMFAIKSVDDYQVSVISMTGLITSMQLASAKGNVDIERQGEMYKQNKLYISSMVDQLKLVDAQTSLNLEQLMAISKQYLIHGQQIDLNDQKQRQSFTNIANALAAQGVMMNAMQINQEMRALLEGKSGPNNALANAANDMALKKYGQNLKELISTWKSEGKNSLEEMGKLFSAFEISGKEMGKTWSGVTSSFETLKTSLAQDAFSSTLGDMSQWVDQLNTDIKNNKEEISEWIKTGWSALKTIIQFFIDNKELVISVFVGLSAAVAGVATAATVAAVSMNIAFAGIPLMIGGVVAGITFAALKWNALTKEVQEFGRNVRIVWAYVTGGEAGWNAQKSIEAAKAAKTAGSVAPAAASTVSVTPAGSISPSADVEKKAKAHGESRVTLLQKWNSEAEKELRNGLMLDDQRNIANKLAEYDIQLRSKKMHELYPQEKSILQETLKKAQEENDIRSQMQRIYEDINKPLEDFSNKQKALNELMSQGKINTADYNRELAKAQESYIKSIDPLHEMKKSLKEEKDLIGLTGSELTLASYRQQASNKLKAEGYDVTNADTRAMIDNLVQQKQFNMYLSEQPNLINSLKDGIKQWGDTMTSTLNGMAWGAKNSFKDILVSFGKMISEIILKTKIIQPLLNSIGLGSTAAPAATSTVKNANGNVYNAGLSAYSNSIVSTPTRFANGGSLMGEAGPEAILPLSRINGVLGVKALTGSSSAPNVQINITNNSGADITKDVTTNFDGENMIIGVVLNAVSTNKGGSKDVLKAALSR